MDVPNYLEDKLKHSAVYELTRTDRAELERDGLEAFIYKALTNKKFRKWAIDESTQQRVKRAIHLNVSKNQPIQLTLPFGGYKLWRLPSAPEVDWAEFFMLSYYLSYMAPIAAAYKPGIALSFSSDDIIIERMNNVSDADTDAYARSYSALLAQFRVYLPANVTIELKRVRDMYPDRSEYERELAHNIERFTKEYAALDATTRAHKEKTSILNIRWDGARDLTGLSDAQKQEVVSFGPILHDATCYVSKRQAFVRGENKIVIFGNKIRNCIPIGTTKTSRTKFWTGFGVLEQRGEKLLDRILSPEQLERAKNEDHEIIHPNLIPLKNFDELWVYPRAFQFSD